LYRLNMTAAVAALLIAPAPLAYAQMGTAPRDTTVAAVTSLGGIIQPDQIRASKMIGSVVYDVQNVDIGKVQDVILDRNGRVASVVVDVGTFLGAGGKNVAVRLSDIKTDNNRLTLDLTKEQLQRAQAYQLENPDTGAGSSISPIDGKLGSAGTDSNTAPRQ
jgi:sporulation protein YlmC with PRC-barrel domain